MRACVALVHAHPTGGPLAICNGAIEGLTRSLALELGPRLRVNCFSPGFVDTERFDHMPADRKAAMLESTASSLPLNRVGQPEAGDVSKLNSFDRLTHMAFEKGASGFNRLKCVIERGFKYVFQII